ncbi:magnesium transporter CorA family protein [Tessaracoccus sp.]|uniref:magnesium transporter CorA family protein n=1 Tax=Tessaracoccus sp. TaxID=1971211 RepID=UPI0026047FB0|nr:magnesium transporter CorA family protein [Tessaracoccus sp.]
MSMVQGRTWRDGVQQRSDVPMAELSEFLADPHLLVWLDLVDPEPELLATLAEELTLDRHAVEDAAAPFERPKATRHAGHVFLTCYATTLTVDAAEGPQLVTPRISAFVLPNGLITVRTGAFDFDEVLQRWADEAQLEQGVGALVHGMLDTVVDGHFDAIQALDDEALEDMLFGDRVRPRAFQQRVFAVRKVLAQLRRKVLPMREVVSAVIRFRTSETLPVSRELDGDFDDLYDHVIRAADWSESLREVVGNAFETSLSLQDARLNDIMKKLAAWAAIIAVPTAVTGWFGQNLPYPGYASGSGLLLSIVLIVAGVAGLYLLFRRVDWL